MTIPSFRTISRALKLGKKIDLKKVLNWAKKVRIWKPASEGKRGQTGLNGAKGCQTGLPRPNGVKRAKKCLTGPNMAKRANGPNKAKWGHMGLIFCMHAYFYKIKKSCFV